MKQLTISRPHGFTRSLALQLLFVSVASSTAVAQGSLVAWGSDLTGVVSGVPAGNDFVQVASGGFHAVALRADGSIVTWGSDDYNQVSNSPSGSTYTQVAAGDNYCLALRQDGSLIWWGDSFGGVGTGLPAGNDYVQVAAGRWHGLALRSDGSIVSWGNDSGGQVTQTPTGTDFVQVSGGSFHSAALRSDGTLACWGAEHSGEVSNTPTGNSFVAIAAGYGVTTALTQDGTLIRWGSAPQNVSGMGITHIVEGQLNSHALRGDGTLAVWGSNTEGQISQAPKGVGYLQSAAGVFHGVAIRADNLGSATCFGDGTGQACPCGSIGSAGEGCGNSTGIGGAVLAASGNAYLTGDTLEVSISGAPGRTMGLLLQGSQSINGGLGNQVGDGLLCAGGETMRAQFRMTIAGSTTYSQFGQSTFGDASFGAGGSSHYQFWYRDTANVCSGSGFNFSNAWAVTWLR